MPACQDLNRINIVVAVDVIGALRHGTLQGHLFLMDDGTFGSSSQGTADLSTVCSPGQSIQWTSYPIDLQTPLAIKEVSFIYDAPTFVTQDNAAACSPARNTSDGYGVQEGGSDDDVPPREWVGIVPGYMVPGGIYRYRLALQMGVGARSVMFSDAASLVRF